MLKRVSPYLDSPKTSEQDKETLKGHIFDLIILPFHSYLKLFDKSKVRNSYSHIADALTQFLVLLSKRDFKIEYIQTFINTLESTIIESLSNETASNAI